MVRNKLVYAFLREDNTPFYIGMGSVDRARNHKKGSRNYRWWEEMKSNPNYKFVIVDRSLSKQQAWDIEIDLIKEFGRERYEENGILTNMHPGGHISEESKKEVCVFHEDGGPRLGTFSHAKLAAEFIGYKWYQGVSVCARGECRSRGKHMFFYTSEVGDIDYIGPVKRSSLHNGGHKTNRKRIFDMEDMVVFPSMNSACRHIKPEMKKPGFWGDWFWDRMLPITEEEYYYLQELKQL